ncbi:MAG: LysM domain-containing protein [Phenylobacterium sp.]
MTRRAPLWLALAGACTLAACASAPKSAPTATAPAPAKPDLATAPADRTRQAIDLLTQGRPTLARPLLVTALVDDPDNRVAKRLLAQIDGEPKALLPGKPKTYTVGPGETFSMLAGRFLGDPLMFYALARYNGFAAPSQLAPGYVLQIPVPERPAVVAKPKPATPAAKAPAEVATARNPGQASSLRAQGLDQLNRGAPSRAVSLLQQAAQLDPANPAIQRDLSRAQRIQASLAR